MIYFIIGGSASGKSSLAESIALKRSVSKGLPVYYLATLDPNSGGDTEQRIKKHRAMREGKGFFTIEVSKNYNSFLLDDNNSILLIEDVGNFCANLIYNDNVTDKDCAVKIAHKLISQSEDTIIVSNDISLDEKIEGAELYYDILCGINNYLAQVCDTAVDVVSGISVVLKGSL